MEKSERKVLRSSPWARHISFVRPGDIGEKLRRNLDGVQDSRSGVNYWRQADWARHGGKLETEAFLRSQETDDKK